jgi:hypothetical protein
VTLSSTAAPTQAPEMSYIELLPVEMISHICCMADNPISCLSSVSTFLDNVAYIKFTAFLQRKIAANDRDLLNKFILHHSDPANRPFVKIAAVKIASNDRLNCKFRKSVLLSFPETKEDIFEMLVRNEPYELLSDELCSALFEETKSDLNLFFTGCIRAGTRIEEVAHFLPLVPIRLRIIALASILTGFDMSRNAILIPSTTFVVLVRVLARSIFGDKCQVFDSATMNPSVSDLVTLIEELTFLDSEYVVPLTRRIIAIVDKVESLYAANHYNKSLKREYFSTVGKVGNSKLLFDQAFCTRHGLTAADRIELLKRLTPDAFMMAITNTDQVTNEVRFVLKGLELKPEAFYSAQNGLLFAAITGQVEEFSNFGELDQQTVSDLRKGEGLIASFLTKAQIEYVLGMLNSQTI